MNPEHQYRKLALMAALSFIAMYTLMYAMVNSFSNVFPNYNQFYMAGLMTSPMVIIELLVMRGMYQSKKLNIAIIASSILLLLLFWAGVREQFAINDKQFLESMIPHHASALLMCEKAKLQDPEIRSLCEKILSGQQSEIDFMKAKLAQLNGS